MWREKRAQAAHLCSLMKINVYFFLNYIARNYVAAAFIDTLIEHRETDTLALTALMISVRIAATLGCVCRL